MKKGFTLIELLAVIVILAIIALISVPIIMNIIDKVKMGALEDSAYGLMESAEFYYSSNMQNETLTVEFTCNENGCYNEDKKLNYKGKINSGRLKLYSNGKISICIENGTNAAMKLANETKVTLDKGSCNYASENYFIDEYISLTEYNNMKEQYEDEIISLTESQLDTSDATATSSDILSSKTAYVNGIKLIGDYSSANIKSLLSSSNNSTTITLPSAGDYLIFATVGGARYNLNTSSVNWSISGCDTSTKLYNGLSTGTYGIDFCTAGGTLYTGVTSTIFRCKVNSNKSITVSSSGVNFYSQINLSSIKLDV